MSTRGTGKREAIFVFGASGHAKVVLDVLEREGRYAVVFLVDDDPALKGQQFFGYPVIGGKDELLAQPAPPRRGIVAIGSNRARRAVADWLAEHDFGLVSTVHPSAQLGRETSIGAGTVIMAGAVVNSAAVIGRNVIVNTRASIDHDCRVGDHVHLAPGTTLCGTVTIGEGSFVCAGATVIPNLTVGNGVTIGAGAIVIRDVADDMTVAGVPAREILKS